MNSIYGSVSSNQGKTKEQIYQSHGMSPDDKEQELKEITTIVKAGLKYSFIY